MAALLAQPGDVLGQRYLPTVQINQYHWQTKGVGVPWRNRDSLAVLWSGNAVPMWHYDWWHNCALYDEQPWAGGYVPMIYREWTDAALACNGGRPLLVGNEPENVEQGNLSPADQAAVLHEAVTRWAGPVYCCGVQAQHINYMRAVMAEYTSRYGPWPGGVHFHLYAIGDDGGTILDAVDADDIARTKAAFDAMLDVIGGQRFVVSECCVLSATMTQNEIAAAAYPLVDYAYSQGAESVAWYSVKSDFFYNASDLVTSNRVNALGLAWLDYMAGWRRP